MNTLIIKEFGDLAPDGAVCIDLAQTEIRNCIGCWTCWWKTPGRCVFPDMEDFYRSYIQADRVILLAKPQCGFVSSRLKTLFDRMLPLFLPYTYCAQGGTWHTPRYPKYPDIEVYYQDDFASEDERKLFCDYLHRVFRQFHSRQVQIMPAAQLEEAYR